MMDLRQPAKMATKVGVAMMEAIDEQLEEEGLSGALKCAAMMATVQVVVMAMAEQIGNEIKTDPRRVIGKVMEAALRGFPETPPKVEDLPRRKVKPGPSPWGL